MFEHLWRHISRFLKLHRTDSTCPPIPLFKRYGTSSSRSFFAAMCDIPIDDRAQCHVRRLTMYKKRNHEFIVAELTNSAYLLVERLAPENTHSIEIASTSSDSSSSIRRYIPADDRVSIYPKKDAKFTNAVSAVELIHDYTFTQFPVLEFARIVAAVSDYSGNYVPNSTMCYWYASVIRALATRLFQGTKSKELRGRTCLVIEFSFDEEASDIIQKNYIQARNANPQPTGPAVAMVIKERRLRQASDERAKQLQQELEQAILEIERYKQWQDTARVTSYGTQSICS